MLKFVMFPRWTLRGRRWFVRIVAKNGEVVAQSEGYVRRIDAQRTVNLIQSQARLAAVEVYE